MKLKLKTARQRDNRKLQAKRGKRAYRMEEGILHPHTGEQTLLRRATGQRIALERQAIRDQLRSFGSAGAELAETLPLRRMEEGDNIALFKQVKLPSVAALMKSPAETEAGLV